MIVYDVGIIDWWTGWWPEDLFLRTIAEDTTGKYRGDFAAGFSIAEYHRDVTTAFRLARMLGWGGDIRAGDRGLMLCGGPPVLYGDYETAPLSFGWKQDNNGQTFIASRLPHEHLEDPTGGNYAFVESEDVAQVIAFDPVTYSQETKWHRLDTPLDASIAALLGRRWPWLAAIDALLDAEAQQ